MKLLFPLFCNFSMHHRYHRTTTHTQNIPSSPIANTNLEHLTSSKLHLDFLKKSIEKGIENCRKNRGTYKVLDLSESATPTLLEQHNPNTLAKTKETPNPTSLTQELNKKLLKNGITQH